MKNTVYRFTISNVIETYKRKIREDSGKEIYTTAIYEPPCKPCYRTTSGGQKVECNKNVFINLTALINNLIKENKIEHGFVICSSDHTTSSVYVNHFETGLMEDLYKYLNKEFPFSPKSYKHNIWDREFANGAAHMKAMMLGKSATVLISDGKLHMGKFEDIIYAEFDYRPDKTFVVSLFSEGEE